METPSDDFNVKTDENRQEYLIELAEVKHEHNGQLVLRIFILLLYISQYIFIWYKSSKQ